MSTTSTIVEIKPYKKVINTKNEGVYVKVKKGGKLVEVQIA